MKNTILLSVIAVSLATTAVAQGVNFEKGDWKSVITKASAEHKLVYVDVYTTWCGPCKILASRIFPQKEAGDKYNKLFVNYRIDAEKGEGVELAKRYAVNGYPTHLFIDPANESVVYREMGASAEVKDFTHHADIALQEKADPMTWEKYVGIYRDGRRDPAFLKGYLNKAKLLDKPNDDVLNAYVSVLKDKRASDSEIVFVFEQIRTLDNDAVAYVAANKKTIAATMPDSKHYFEDVADRWLYKTFEKAVDQKQEALIDLIITDGPKYTGKKDEAMNYWYRTQYFTKIGDREAALKAGIAEANFLTGKPEAYFIAEDAKELENAKASIRMQLVMTKVPAEKLDEVVAANVKAQPAMSHGVSSRTASKLNELSWRIYEQYPKDASLVRQALVWSKRSLELSNATNDWPAIADTYAHLLYVSGDREGAIKLQTEAIAKAKVLKTDASQMDEALKLMRAGKL